MSRCREATVEKVSIVDDQEADVDSPGLSEVEPEAVLLPTVTPTPISEPVKESDELEPDQEVPKKTPVRMVEGKAQTKKGVIRDLVKSGRKVTVDDLIQAVIDAGFVQDTESARKKARGYIHMCISEFKKKGTEIYKKGEYYVSRKDGETETE
jgi:hypothetical protein